MLFTGSTINSPWGTKDVDVTGIVVDSEYSEALPVVSTASVVVVVVVEVTEVIDIVDKVLVLDLFVVEVVVTIVGV